MEIKSLRTTARELAQAGKHKRSCGLLTFKSSRNARLSYIPACANLENSYFSRLRHGQSQLLCTDQFTDTKIS